MPSSRHETLVEMFRHRPALAAELLAGALGMELPRYEQARVDSGDFTDVAPTEYRADAAVVLTAGKVPVLAVVVEVQLGRDRDKRWTWPVYLATLRARLRCPTVLLVVCVEAATADWYAVPIELGHPGWLLTPLVLRPDRVPVVVGAAQARRAPEIAVLSALAHGGRPDGRAVLDALPEAFAMLDEQHALLYADVVFAALPVAAQRHLEALMAGATFEYQSDFARRYYGQGRADGGAEAVLAVLDARGFHVPEPVRARISECSDVEQLDTWVRRAATAGSVEDIFQP